MFGIFKRENVNSVHVNELDNITEKINLIDIREPYEYQSGSIKTARNIPMGTLLDKPENYLQPGKTYYIMCQSGGRSANATQILSRKGYDVVNVAGGMGAYTGSKRK